MPSRRIAAAPEGESKNSSDAVRIHRARRKLYENIRSTRSGTLSLLVGQPASPTLEREERLDCTYKFSRIEMLTPFTSADNPTLSTMLSLSPQLDRCLSPSKFSPIMASSYTRTAIS
jgi:hypothetical protein